LITPKALANSSPGLERSDKPGGNKTNRQQTLKAFALKTNPFRVDSSFLVLLPGLSLCSNPGLELANAFGVLANAFGVFFQLNEYCITRLDAIVN